MKIGILGAGKMASALGGRFVASHHELLVSARDPANGEKVAAALGRGTRAGSPADATRFGDVVILATAYADAARALDAAGDLRGKIVWSIVTPLAPDLSGLVIGTTTSGNEEIARSAPDARYVAGWPPFADVIESPTTRFGGQRSSLFHCGDDVEAKRALMPLFDALDVDAVDCGPLRAARFIEPAMFLLVHLAYREQMGQVAARLLRR